MWWWGYCFSWYTLERSLYFQKRWRTPCRLARLLPCSWFARKQRRGRNKPVLRQAERSDHHAALVVDYKLPQDAAEFEQAAHAEVHRLLQQKAATVLQLLLQAVDVDEDSRHETDLGEVFDSVTLDSVPRALLSKSPEGRAQAPHGRFHSSVVLGLMQELEFSDGHFGVRLVSQDVRCSVSVLFLAAEMFKGKIATIRHI